MIKLHVKMALTMTTYIHEQHHLVLVQYFHTIDEINDRILFFLA